MMNSTTYYRFTSSRVFISTALTSAILFCQLLLFHYYYITFSSQYKIKQNQLESIYCDHRLLAGIQDLAIESDVELVLVDPDLVESDEYQKKYLNDEFSFSKRSQESTQKSIVHLAAINETSGGQPNLKLFYESLKNRGYVTLQYDSSYPMQPEVYRRPSHLFDGAHELQQDQSEKVSKIYTEFIAHIFVLNRTHPPEQERNRCDNKILNQDSRNTVIHIFLLYNFESDPQNQWIQPALLIDEMDKHKLLTYNVHWVDFRLPIEHHYLHPKRSIASISITSKMEFQPKVINLIKVFEPETNRVLTYVNNSFIYCKNLPFNISGLIDNQRRVNKYSMNLQTSRPETEGELRVQLQSQIELAMRFMSTYSQVYGGFSHWLTGSSLLFYLRFCDLAIISSELVNNDVSLQHTVNLEFGVFANEFNETIQDALASATNIGVKMISDWRKKDRTIHFKLADCPSISFRIYPYELRKDFDQYYYITQSSMISSQKRKRKQSGKAIKSDSEGYWGHHVFGLHNLELCWTQIGGVAVLIRVPCNIYDHLRRIFIV